MMGSWLLDPITEASLADAERTGLSEHVPGSGEERWTALAVIDECAPAPISALD